MQHYDIEIFNELDQTFEEEFFKYGSFVSFKKKETPFLGDELSKYFYIVLKGKIKSFQMNLNNAKEQTLFIYRKGDMFDTFIMLDTKVHEVLYEVLEPSELLQFPIEKVRQWIQTNDAFRRHFFLYLASQMRHEEELASELSLYSTSERLSKLLLQNMNPNNNYYYQLLQNISKTEIAKLLGTVRNVVERHLKELEAHNIIKNKRKHIYVQDVQKLIKNSKKLLLK